jgi:hypothetical protein
VKPLHCLLAAAIVCSPVPLVAQQDDPDAVRIALTWHRLTDQPLDVQRVAERSDAVRRASNFDRPDALAAEVSRVEAMLAAANANELFQMQISDRISEYDHDLGEFSITLFQPGYFIPITAFGEQYQVVFANAEAARPIPMAKEEARAFDQRLNAIYRNVITEVQFRIIGGGDPTGGVTGARVIRAELVSAKVTDRDGRLIATPNVTPAAAAAPFDPRGLDVAGFRVGVSVADLSATLERLYGPVERGGPGENPPPGMTGVVRVNSMGCMSLPGRPEAKPGAVCLTAWHDDKQIVRAIRIERLFPSMDGETVRKSLVARYGPVTKASGNNGFTLGWGPDVVVGRTANGPIQQATLLASFGAHESFMSRGTNRIPETRVVLHLVDVEWASRQPQ